MSTIYRASKIITLVVTCLGTFMVLLDASIVVVALPTIQVDLHAKLSDLQWTVDAYTLPLAALMLTAGTLGDRFGRKRLFLFGMVLFLLGSTFCGFASTLGWLLTGRALQGVGAAALVPGSLSVLAATFTEPRERAQAIGIWAGVSGMALAAGPLAGGLLIQLANWPAIFFVNLPIGMIAFALGLPLLAESRNPNTRRIDIPGQVLVTGALTCLIMALIEGSSQGWTSPLILSLFTGSIVLLATFLLVEARTREPLLPLDLFANRTFSIANIASIVLGFAMQGTIFFMLQYLQDVQGYSALEAGLRTLPATVTIFLTAPFAGRLTARLGPRLPIVLGTLLCSVSLFLVATIVEPDTSFIMLSWQVGLFGIGCGLMMTPLTAVVLSATPRHRTGLGSSILSTSRQVGITLGIAILGAYVLQQLPGNITSQLTQRGVPGPASAAIANKLSAAGAGASRVALPGRLPLPPAALRQAIGQAFVDSIHGAFLIAGIALFVIALLVALLLREKQQQESIQTEAASLPEVSEGFAIEEVTG